MGSADANNEAPSGDHLPRPPLRISNERTRHPAPALSVPVGAQSCGMVQMQRGKTCSLRTGKAETRAQHSYTCLGPQDVQMPHDLPPRSSGCTRASPRLRGTGKNVTHCTEYAHRRAMGTSPSWGLWDTPREKPQGADIPGVWGAMGLTHHGSRQPPDPHAPRVAAPEPPWHEADKDSRHQCGVDKICS